MKPDNQSTSRRNAQRPRGKSQAAAILAGKRRERTIGENFLSSSWVMWGASMLTITLILLLFTPYTHQLDEIKNGNFSDEDIENTLMSIQNSLSAIGDVPSSYTGWYFGRFCEGDCRTPDEVFSDYKAVTRERIMNAAASMKLDTVYVMAQKEVQD